MRFWDIEAWTNRLPVGFFAYPWTPTPSFRRINKWYRASSESISAIGFDPDHHVLEIEFRHRGSYQYMGVPERLFRELLNAPSKGNFVNAFILRSGFKMTKTR